MSYRRLAVLLGNAPRDSAYVHSLLGEDWPWDMTAMLLAALVDLTAGANWQRGGGQGNKPKPIPRPGIGRPSKRKHTGAAVPLDKAANVFPFR